MEDLVKYIFENKPSKFFSRPIYMEESDSVLFFVDDSDYFARRIDELLTIYLKMDDESLVGVEVKGVKHLLSQLPGFGVTVQTEDMDIRIIFAAYLLRKNLNAKDAQYLGDIIGACDPQDTRVKIPAL